MAKPESGKPESGRKDAGRRGGALRPVAAMVPRITGRAFGRRGLAQAGLIAEWPEIVGAELAAVCRPQRLSFPRRDRRGEGTLALRVALGHATVLQHLEPLIVERVNGFFGYRAVARLRLHQAPLPPQRKAARQETAPLPAGAEAELDARLTAVGDDQLRGALQRLGRALLQARPQSSKS